MSDPFAELGLRSDATLDEIRSARRRLARERHPDVGGSVESMQALNRAFDAAIGHVTGRRPVPTATAAPEPAATDRTTRRRSTIRRDAPSFTIDALPAEAFEALLVVTSWMGEVLVDDPPYLLETMLHDPVACWCRLDLVPDAGASTVSITVAAYEGGNTPDPEAVRDRWVSQLNELGGQPW